jgi:hypothetical protein
VQSVLPDKTRRRGGGRGGGVDDLVVVHDDEGLVSRTCDSPECPSRLRIEAH